MNLRLGDVCEFIVDCEHKTAPLSDAGYPSIRTPNVGRGRLKLEGVSRVSEEIYRVWTKRATPRANDIIIAREAPVGNAAIIREGQIVCLGQRTVLLRPDPNKIAAEYLVYFLLGTYCQQRFKSVSQGATVPHLNMKDIRELALPPLPPMNLQRKIGDVLSAYDDLIELNQRRISILEEMPRRLFEEWFVRFMFPGVDNVVIVESALGQVPANWVIGRLSECVDVNPETLSPKRAPSHIAYIDIASVSPGHLESVQELMFADAPSRARRVVRDGDVIWSTVRPNRRAHALLLAPPPNTICSTGFAVLRSKHGDWAWIYEATQTDAFVAYLEGRATGAAYPAVTASVFESAQIAIPPLDLRMSFQAEVEAFYRMQANLHQQNAKLRAARDLLLPRLISGEVELGDAERELEDAA